MMAENTTASWKPSLLQRLGGILDGQTREQQIAEHDLSVAQAAALQRKLAIQGRLAKLLAGDEDAEGPAGAPPMTPSPAAAPKRMGPVMDEGIPQPDAPPVAPSAVPMPSKRRFDPDRLQRILTAAAYSGDDGAGKAAEVMSKLRPDLDKGMFVDADGTVRLRPGYADASREAAGASTGGSEAARAALDVIAVPMPDGSTFSLPRAAYIALQQSGSAPGLGVSQTPGARARAEAKGRAPTEFITTQDAQGRPVTMAKSVAAGGTFVGQDDATGEYEKVGAKTAADRYKALQDAGNKAPGLISKYQQVQRLLGDFEGGKLAPAGLEIASALNSLGFKMSPSLSNAQAADSIVKQVTLDSLGGGLGAAISNRDRDFVERTQPSLQTSAAGRKTLIEMQVKTLQRQQQVAGMARQWQQRFGRIDTPDATGKTFDDYLQAWSDRNRLFVPKEKR